MFKRLLIFLSIAISTISCIELEQTVDLTDILNKSDYYYLSTDHIIIVPKISSDTQYIEFTLDSLYTHTSTKMPFILELEADTLSLGYHIVNVRQIRTPSTGIIMSTTTNIDFTIL